MTVTPQAIRDAEFQVKLRGYDQAEVKEYLERIAEDHLKLIERLDMQERSIEALSRDNHKLRQESKSCERKIIDARNTVEETKNTRLQEKEQFEKQEWELKTLRRAVGQLEEEKLASTKRQGLADIHIKKLQAGMLQEQSREKELLQRMQLLEKQNQAAQREESDLKKALATAQKLSDGMIQDSEKQAREILTRARLEIEKLRRQAKEELAYFPAEIQRMREQHDKLKGQVRSILKNYLESFDNALTDVGALLEEEEGKPPQKEMPFKEKPAEQEALAGSDELFQSIPISDNMSFDNEDLDDISEDVSLSLDMEHKP